MTQANPIIGSGKTGTEYRTADNDGKQALLNHHKGAAAPSYKEAGALWLDDAATPWVLKIYDGADWIKIADIHAANNTCTTYNGASQIDKTDFTVTKTGAPALFLKGTDITAGNKSRIVLNSGNASGTDTTFAELQINASQVTAGNEDGILLIKTTRSGTNAERLKVGSGIYTPGATDNGANSITALTMQSDVFRTRSISIVNNTAYDFTPGSVNGHMTVSVDNGSTNKRLFGAYSVYASGYFCTSISAGTDFAVTTGALSGTTGTSGKITVSTNVDGKMYIENRSGSTQTVRVTIF